MKIEAIFIIEHDYLNHKDQTINLSEEFRYSFREDLMKNLVISREVNENYIPNFWKVNENSNLESINAIVGENGSGKTSILKMINSIYRFGNSNMKGAALFKNNDGQYSFSEFGNDIFLKTLGIEPVIQEDDEDVLHKEPIFNNAYFEFARDDKSKLERLSSKDIDHSLSLYYSPHFSSLSTTNYQNQNISHIQFFFNDVFHRTKFDFGRRQETFYGVLSKTMVDFYFSSAFKKVKEVKGFLKLPEINEIQIQLSDLQDNSQYIFRNYDQLDKTIIQNFKIISRQIDNENFGENNNQALTLWKRKFFKNYLIILLESYTKVLSSINFNLPDKFDFENDSSISMIKELLTKLYYVNNETNKLNVKVHMNYLGNVINNPKQHLFLNPGEFYYLTVGQEEATKFIHLEEELYNDLNHFMAEHIRANGGNQKWFQIQRITSFKTFSDLSSGEFDYYMLFAQIHKFISEKIKNESSFHLENLILTLDEADLSFHPEWKRKFVYLLSEIIPIIIPKKYVDKVRIIFTTHDPLCLSDIPKFNTILLSSTNNGHKKTQELSLSTFGANIHDILSESYFLKGGHIGEFAQNKINYVINWINEHRRVKKINQDQYENCKKIISLIDEPILKRKLTEMLSEIQFDEEFINSIIEQETRRLNNLLKRNKN